MSEKGRQHCGSLGKASYLYVEVLAHVELAELHAALQTPHVARTVQKLCLRATSFLGLVVSECFLAQVHASD